MTTIRTAMPAALRRCLLLASLAPALAAGQPPARSPARSTPAPAATPAENLRVYLMTMGPGDAVWEKFGHNAVWIRDTTRGLDVAYNWGLFDFNDADFLPRFLKGSMRYWMGGYPGVRTVEAYASYNRSVWAQELSMTPAEKQALVEFVQWNERPENRFYHYDYFRDNCSTRVRDALDRALGGRLRAALDTVATGTTYRWHTRRLTEGSLPVYVGMDIVLGPSGDRLISAWEEAFLPMLLRDHLRNVTVADPTGATEALVIGESQLFAATRPPEPEAPSNRLPAFLVAGVLLGGLSGILGTRTSRPARIGATVAGVLWSVTAGLVGTVMALSWGLTDHVFMYRNENLLQLSPLSLLLAVLVPGLFMSRRRSKLVWRLSATVAALSILGFALQGLPAFDQVNGQFLALALPAHLGVAWAAYVLATRRQGT